MSAYHSDTAGQSGDEAIPVSQSFWFFVGREAPHEGARRLQDQRERENRSVFETIIAPTGCLHNRRPKMGRWLWKGVCNAWTDRRLARSPYVDHNASGCAVCDAESHSSRLVRHTRCNRRPDLKPSISERPGHGNAKERPDEIELPERADQRQSRQQYRPGHRRRREDYVAAPLIDLAPHQRCDQC